MANKRKAVIIGINYDGERIDALKGAVNDAKDLHTTLTRENDYSFDIGEEHYLSDEEASSDAVRKALSDLLWREEKCEVALFYFSGHGFKDSYGNGYLAPYDMDPEEPFVKGISFDEIRNLMANAQHQNIFIILDCCYSGLTTEKAINDPHNEVGNILEIAPDRDETSQLGKTFFVSSGPSDKSRERSFKPYKGDDDPNEHFHGTFTYYLLKGLNGGVKAEDQSGTIQWNSLKSYVSSQIKNDRKAKQEAHQKQSGVDTSEVVIAQLTEEFHKYCRRLLDLAAQSFSQEDLCAAMDRLNELNNRINPKSESGEKIVGEINDLESKIGNRCKKARGWFGRNIRRFLHLPVKDEMESLLRTIANEGNIRKLGEISDDDLGTAFYHLFRVSSDSNDLEEEYKLDLFISEVENLNYPSNPKSKSDSSQPKSKDHVDRRSTSI